MANNLIELRENLLEQKKLLDKIFVSIEGRGTDEEPLTIGLFKTIIYEAISDIKDEINEVEFLI